jgi:proteasome accessory factor A
MDQTGSRDNWAAQKKIDIKYHELSHQGYYHMMVQSLELTPFISPDEMKRAMRLPPLDTPATQRSYWIREFACEHTKLEVDWQTIRWIDERGKHKTGQIGNHDSRTS